MNVSTSFARRLNDWVAAGGTLIGLGGGAVAYLADPRTGLLAISQENVVRESAPVVPAGGGRGGTTATPGNTPAAGQIPPPTPAIPAARVPGKLLTSDQDFDKAFKNAASDVFHEARQTL